MRPPPARAIPLFALLLAAVNVFAVWKLFTVEYTTHLHTTDGAFIALSRFIASHPSDLLWWPFWNAGMPFQHTYFPLLPAVAALTATLTGWSPALSFHAVSASFYTLGPVALFLLAWVLSRRAGYSFLAGLLYSLVAPSAFLLPAIRQDVGSVWNPRRLHALVFYGENPHVASLALLCLHVALTRRSLLLRALAGVSLAAVVLTNAFGVVALAIAALCLLCAYHDGSVWRRLGVTAIIGILSYLWISPWLPPTLLQSIWFNSQTAGGDYRWSWRSGAALAVIAVAFLIARAATRGLRSHLRFAVMFAAVMTAIPAVRRVPIHGLDVEPIMPLIPALDDPALPPADLRWVNLHSARIRAIVRPGQVVFVQMNYHPGWRATVNGLSQPVSRDGLGLMVIEPDCAGPCEIELVFDGGLESKLTRLASLAVVFGLILYLLFTRLLSPRSGSRNRVTAVR